ncbi:MAG: phage tail sheath family protein [Acidimicrobiia bacterium]
MSDPVPGVFIEETSSGARPIDPVSTSTAGIVGATLVGPNDGKPRLVTSFAEFERDFGGVEPLTLNGVETPNYVAHAARAFFGNGGRRLWVQRVAGVEAITVETLTAALAVLEHVDEISIVMMPDMARLDAGSMINAATALIARCERRGDRIALIDPPKNSTIADVRRFRANFDSSYAALYYPWVVTVDAAPVVVPPSGFVAGIYARVDGVRGVHKAPANELVNGIAGFESAVTSSGQEMLNPDGINALRSFVGRGNRVWGARTLSNDPEWTYVNVRRLFVYLENSIDRSTRWVVFEPNDEPLWRRIRSTVEDFLSASWRDGALVGSKQEEAFFVRCDRSTMTQDDLDNGRLVCLVGVATVRPAEFVIFRIGQLTADARATNG